MSNFVVFDTSIFIDHLRTGRHHQRIAETTGLVRNSAVVLAELIRGATRPAEQAFVERLARNHPILTPNENNWLESGRLLSKMHVGKGFAPEKLRDLHFDLLIALTARSAGARLVTSNRADFEIDRELLQTATGDLVSHAPARARKIGRQLACLP